MASSRTSRKEKKQQVAINEEINPHIPQYIATAPWYMQDDEGSKKVLFHQRAELNKKETYDSIDTWYERGQKVSSVPTKFRKGACTNCGAMTHKTRDCCERPRKIGAKWTGKDIQPDEIVKEVRLDWDGKRDRWNGYDPESHTKLVEQYAHFEQERQKIKKKENLGNSRTVGSNGNAAEEVEAVEEDSEKEDEDKKDFLDTTEQPVGVKKDPKTRTTIRNLRIREDTAKYLRNLSLNSAHYDPKSRSMRVHPDSKEALDSGSDSFVHQSGAVQSFYQMQGFSFTAYEKGQSIHMQALPSQAELVYKKYLEKKDEINQQSKNSILQKYGEQEKYQASDPSLIFGQTEQFLEYTHDGTLLDPKAKEKLIPSTKYEEDVYINNHTSVWGSFWDNGEWGYACCHQTVKRSYCTGEAGKKARLEMKEEMVNRQKVFSKSNTVEYQQLTPSTLTTSDKKRTFASLGYGELTQEEYDEYLLKKARTEDPMKDFLKKSKT